MRKLFDLLWLHRQLRPILMSPPEKRSALSKLGLAIGYRYYKALQYCAHGAFIALEARIGQRPKMIHGYRGILIAGQAVIGDDVTMFHHITIGASFTKDGKVKAAPVVGNRVLLGANVTLIGNCHIGDDARIGASVTLVDATIPPGATIVNASAYNLTDGRPVYQQPASQGSSVAEPSQPRPE